MKHYLVNSSLYGIGAGICVFISVQNLIARTGFGFCSLFLVILILIMFVIKEILPRTNSESPDSKSQTWDKILLFMFLSVSGVGDTPIVGMMVGGIGVFVGGIGVAGGAPHPIRSNKTSDVPITC